MLKWFAKYNKFILAIGGSLLMIVFLVEPALDVLQFTPASEVIGRLDGKKVRARDQWAYSNQLETLGRLNPGILSLIGAERVDSDNTLRWMLLVHDAQRMGLSVSSLDVEETILMLIDGQSSEDVEIFALENRLSADGLRIAVRNWLLYEQYRQLMLGLAYERLDEPMTIGIRRLIYLSQAAWAQFGQAQGQFAMIRLQGLPRVSEPLVKHRLSESENTLVARALLIDSRRYLEEVPDPDEAALQALFEQYRDDLPGRSQPFGFGYRYPDRVKLEYLTIPVEACREKVRPDIEFDMVSLEDYYEQHKSDFEVSDTDPTDPDAEPRWRQLSFEEALPQVIDRKVGQRAEQLAHQIARAAHGMLIGDVRRQFPRDQIYFTTDAETSIMALSRVAEQLEEQFGIRPRVHYHVDDWLTRDDLLDLPGLGDSFIAGQRQQTFTAYVRSAREMNPDPANPLLPRRLQTLVPSEVMQTRDGSRYLFRLVDAQPAASPQSLDEVREQVLADARRKAAYDRLLTEQEQWLARAREEGLQTLADELEKTVQSIRDINRRGERWQFDMDDEPTIRGIGRSGKLIETMFELAEQKQSGGRLEDVPVSELTGIAPVDARMSLALFQLEDYIPITEQAYKRAADASMIGFWGSDLVAYDIQEEALSLDALIRRTGYRHERPLDREEEREADDQ